MWRIAGAVILWAILSGLLVYYGLSWWWQILLSSRPRMST